MGRRNKPQKKKVQKKFHVPKQKKVNDEPDVDMNDPTNIYDDVEAFHNDDAELEIGLNKVLHKKQKKVEDVLHIGGYSSSDNSELEDEVTLEHKITGTENDDGIQSTIESDKRKLTEANVEEVKKSQNKMKKSVNKSVLHAAKGIVGDADSSDDDVDHFGEHSDYYKSISKQIEVMEKERVKLKSFLEKTKSCDKISEDIKEYFNTKLLIISCYLTKMSFYIYLVQSNCKAEGHPILRDIAKVKYHLEDIEGMNIQLPKVPKRYAK